MPFVIYALGLVPQPNPNTKCGKYSHGRSYLNRKAIGIKEKKIISTLKFFNKDAKKCLKYFPP